MISFGLNPGNLCVDCPDDPVQVMRRLVSVVKVTVLYTQLQTRGLVELHEILES